MTDADAVTDGGRPEQCQYGACGNSVSGALDFYFGVRFYCAGHFREMMDAWNQTAEMEVLEEPSDGE